MENPSGSIQVYFYVVSRIVCSERRVFTCLFDEAGLFEAHSLSLYKTGFSALEICIRTARMSTSFL